jgi:hypothetical protein
MVAGGDVRRQVPVDPPSALIRTGAPHQAINDRFGLLEQFVEQEGAEETCRPGQEYVSRLVRIFDRRVIRANGWVENHLRVQIRDRNRELVERACSLLLRG